MNTEPQKVQVEYSFTPTDKLEQVREAVREIADNLERIEQAQQRLKEIGVVSLKVEVEL